MSAKAPDPFYDRKPVPTELIDGIGYSGLTSTEESNNRERKYSSDKGDLRKFWNPKSKDGKLDPFYQRKPVPDALLKGVGDTGLSQEEEYMNRERKYSVNGVDVRKFGDSAKGGWHPTDDPYYGRKSINKKEIDGVGETNMTPAEAFEVRETKTAMFDLSKDPFQQITGSGHRASISGAAAVEHVADVQRRRSSAVAPDHLHDAHQHHQHHSGYDGDNKLAPISNQDEERIADITPSAVHNENNIATNNVPGNHVAGSDIHGDNVDPTTNTTTTTTTTTTTHVSSGGHTNFYDAATKGLDEVAPHEQR